MFHTIFLVCYNRTQINVFHTAEYVLFDIADKLQKGQTVYGCNFPVELRENGEEKGIRFVDYMKVEGVASRNNNNTFVLNL